jgi:N-glycosylase/DNA lyase
MRDIHASYEAIKPQVDKRLAEFAATGAGTDAIIWKEMCFCTCTPQNNAHRAWAAVEAADQAGLLTTGSADELAVLLRNNGVRFHNHKARYIRANQERFFPQTSAKVRAILQNSNSVRAGRDALAAQVAGWGLKEASHFLRNIGLGADVAILDRHILRRLASCGVIATVPASLTKSAYHETENSMAAFAQAEAVPLDALDLVFWYEETNELFK